MTARETIAERLRKVDELIKSVPDLANVNPLASEIQAWLDRAHATLADVDWVEASILKIHAARLLERTRKDVSAAEIVETLRRARWKIEHPQVWRPTGKSGL